MSKSKITNVSMPTPVYDMTVALSKATGMSQSKLLKMAYVPAMLRMLEAFKAGGIPALGQFQVDLMTAEAVIAQLQFGAREDSQVLPAWMAGQAPAVPPPPTAPPSAVLAPPQPASMFTNRVINPLRPGEPPKPASCHQVELYVDPGRHTWFPIKPLAQVLGISASQIEAKIDQEDMLERSGIVYVDKVGLDVALLIAEPPAPDVLAWLEYQSTH